MLRLVDGNGIMTESGREIDARIDRDIIPVVKALSDMPIDICDLEYLLMQFIGITLAEQRLARQIKNCRAMRDARDE